MEHEILCRRTVGLVALAVLPTLGMVALLAEFVPNARAEVGKPSDVKMIPWVELNWPNLNDPNNCPATQRVLDGLEFWAEVTDTAVVTTKDGKAQLYEILYTKLEGRGVTNLRIIPGLKPCYMATDGCSFNDPDFWYDPNPNHYSVAYEVEAIQAVYDDMNEPMPEFVFENESLTCCYYSSGECEPPQDPNCDCDFNFPSDPSLSGLSQGLHDLPTGILY